MWRKKCEGSRGEKCEGSRSEGEKCEIGVSKYFCDCMREEVYRKHMRDREFVRRADERR